MANDMINQMLVGGITYDIQTASLKTYDNITDFDGTVNDDLFGILRKMGSYSMLVQDWAGTAENTFNNAAGGTSALLRTNMPWNHGTLIIITPNYSSNTVHPAFIEFIPYTETQPCFFRYMSTVNATHDSGWFSYARTNFKIGGIPLTGDITLAQMGAVPQTRKIAGVALSSDVTIAQMGVEPALNRTTGTITFESTNFVDLNSSSYLYRYGKMVTLMIRGIFQKTFNTPSGWQSISLMSLASGYRPAKALYAPAIHLNVNNLPVGERSISINTSGSVVLQSNSQIDQNTRLIATVTYMIS